MLNELQGIVLGITVTVILFNLVGCTLMASSREYVERITRYSMNG